VIANHRVSGLAASVSDELSEDNSICGEVDRLVSDALRLVKEE
jgi:hypothetical protein